MSCYRLIKSWLLFESKRMLQLSSKEYEILFKVFKNWLWLKADVCLWKKKRLAASGQLSLVMVNTVDNKRIFNFVYLKKSQRWILYQTVQFQNCQNLIFDLDHQSEYSRKNPWHLCKHPGRLWFHHEPKFRLISKGAESHPLLFCD